MACAAGQAAGLPPPTRLSGEVGDHGTAVPAVTDGARVTDVGDGGAVEEGAGAEARGAVGPGGLGVPALLVRAVGPMVAFERNPLVTTDRIAVADS
jgi:hypothetical protein